MIFYEVILSTSVLIVVLIAIGFFIFFNKKTDSNGFFEEMTTAELSEWCDMHHQTFYLSNTDSVYGYVAITTSFNSFKLRIIQMYASNTKIAKPKQYVLQFDIKMLKKFGIYSPFKLYGVDKYPYYFKKDQVLNFIFKKKMRTYAMERLKEELTYTNV